MKRRLLFFLLLILPVLIPQAALLAQTSTTSSTNTSTSDPNMTSTQFDMTGFPQWAKDLRRAEIVAFGSFPFMYFFTNFGFDTFRMATNGWDRRYAPWPIKGAGAIDQTQSEKVKVLWIAAGGAVLVSLVDYGIVRYKRSREEREIRNLPPGTPIIIRTPLSEDEGEGPDTGTGTAPATDTP